MGQDYILYCSDCNEETYHCWWAPEPEIKMPEYWVCDQCERFAHKDEVEHRMNSNYPDGVTGKDIDALFNDPYEERWFYFEPAIVSLAVKAESLEHAMEILSAKFPQSDKTVELDYYPDKVTEEV